MLGNKAVKIFIQLSSIWYLISPGKSHDHDNDNFEEWGKISKICSTGKHQSPIDISVKSVIENDDSGHYLQFMNYDEKFNGSIFQKDGAYSAKLTGSWNDIKPAISGLALSNEEYVFESAHIHWGQYDHDGTEHSFGGKKYAAELHSVHVNVKYANKSEALNYPDGLAVIGILYEVDDEMPRNIGMHQFASASKISMSENNVPALFDLSSFLPKSISSFYRYDGSLTTPPCTENVRWIVLGKPQAIHSLTMELLRNSGSNIIESKPVRPLRQINGRKIELYSHNY